MSAKKITCKIIKTEPVDWRALKPLQSDNLKEMTKDSYAKLRQSMINNNFIMPFAVWQNKKDIFLIDGHHRQKVLFKLVKEGVDVPDKIPANFIDCANRKEAVKLILVFTSQYARTTDEGLYELISTEGFDFADLKYEIDLPNIDIDRFEQNFYTDPNCDADDEIPEVKKTDIKLGDVFQLGDHRMMCGDSTKKEDVEKLMAGEKADMVFTDPPYGMNLDTDFSKMTSGNSFASGNKHNRVINDDKQFDASFLIDMAKEVVLFGSDYYVNTLPNFGKDGSWMIWDKRSSESQDKGFGSCFETIWSKQKHKRWILRHEWFGFFTGGEKREYDHPTTKPIGLLVNILDKIKTDGEDIILDLFGGSGSTLIACEKFNRKCRMMEIDPLYCQLIIDRWQNFTGQKAAKI